MTLFITVPKRRSPGAAGLSGLSCGQTCPSSGSAGTCEPGWEAGPPGGGRKRADTQFSCYCMSRKHYFQHGLLAKDARWVSRSPARPRRLSRHCPELGSGSSVLPWTAKNWHLGWVASGLASWQPGGRAVVEASSWAPYPRAFGAAQGFLPLCTLIAIFLKEDFN